MTGHYSLLALSQAARRVRARACRARPERAGPSAPGCGRIAAGRPATPAITTANRSRGVPHDLITAPRSPVTAGPRTTVLDGFQVRAAGVGAQLVQRDHVHGDDGQRPE